MATRLQATWSIFWTATLCLKCPTGNEAADVDDVKQHPPSLRHSCLTLFAQTKKEVTMNEEYKIELSPVSDEAATGVAKEIINATQAKLGFVPNMYRTMANSGGYLSTYAHGYDAFR
jgi:hypothetical protein